MAGMLQVITYLLCFYLVIRGVEILQIGLASGRDKRVLLVGIGLATLAVCVAAALGFANMQDQQAASLSMPASSANIPGY